VSTANPGAFSRTDTRSVEVLPNDGMDGLIEATAQATEEAIVNALVAAETMTGRDGNTLHAIPHERLRETLRKYNRLAG
ncbi:MAG TPA: P1 family peptidase, partial [Inquilinus sp.]|nr:P1 family peptidase [Inquilinus sp.]